MVSTITTRFASSPRSTRAAWPMLRRRFFRWMRWASSACRALALHAELAQRIHRKKRRRSIGHAALVERGLLAKRVVIVDTIHQEDIGFLPLSVDAERAK